MREHTDMLEGGFWVFILEGAMALLLGVLIVWWTLPRKKKDDRPPR